MPTTPEEIAEWRKCILEKRKKDNKWNAKFNERVDLLSGATPENQKKIIDALSQPEAEDIIPIIIFLLEEKLLPMRCTKDS